MRLARAEEDRLARLQPDIVQHQRRQHADVPGELALQLEDELPHVFFRRPDVSCAVPLHKLR